MTTMFDISITWDNESMYKIVDPFLRRCKTITTFAHLNEWMMRVVSGMTTAMRFDGELNIGIEELQTNLVPFPRIHHMMVSHAPITTKATNHFDASNVEGITIEALDSNRLMVDCEPLAGKWIALCLMYRGLDCKPDECHKAVSNARDVYDMQFIEWMPTGIKIGVNHDPVRDSMFSMFGQANKALTTIINNTDVINKFHRITEKFDNLWNKERAFFFWYQRYGMSEDDFVTAREVVASFGNDYNNVMGILENDEN